MGTRVLGLAGMISMVACGGAENASSQQPEGYRPEAKTHKVQLTSQQAQQLEQSGASHKVIGDYGSFKLVEVDDKGLASLPEGAEPRDDYNQLLLNAGTIDTMSAHGQQLRGMKLQASGKSFHIVQYSGPIRPEWYQELEATGVKVVTYLPNNAYIVYGDVTALTNLQQRITTNAAIQWNGDYLNDYKLNPAIHKVQTGTDSYEIQLIKDEEANAPTLDLIRGLQAKDGTIQEALGYVNVTAYLTVKDLYEIAARPDVFSIQPRPLPRKFDERQNMVVSGNLTGTQPNRGAGWLQWLADKGFTQAQFTASGFGVDVTDSGVDNASPAAPNHFGLYVGGNISNTSRLAYSRLEGTPHSGSTIQGCDGHGNINAHIIAGYSNRTGMPYADALGFNYGLGVAPFVKVGSSVIFDPDTFTSPDYEDLQSRAYRDGMRVSSNSWGASVSGAYNADAQRYDALVRDAQPASSAVPVAGNQEMVIVFAAGNSGSSAGTVGAPGSAKNIITSGASENVHAFGGADFCNIGDTGADSAMDIISFSSRGPAADGRKKPELMAPGTHVTGGVAQTDAQRANPPANPLGQALGCFDASGVCAGPQPSDFFPVGQEWYTSSDGTSHSTPAIAGGAALVRQYFINHEMPPPSAAMTKGYLMNSARYMTGVGANDNLWSNNQGMGLMDLGMAFDGFPRLIDDQNPANLFTASGQTRTFTGVVSDSAKPFRVTVAWTDAPGSTTGSAWKNNLDLSVTVGGNTYKGNVFTGANSVTGGNADGSNNVESVFLPAGADGPYTVTVTATNINSDGVPGNSSNLDQDFALVAYNSCASAPTAPDGVSAVTNGDNRIDVSWTENGSAAYNVYRSTTAGGPYTRIATVAAPPYSDIGVSGNTTYYYVVRSTACAESPKSTEASVTATGLCTLPPTFAGVSSVTDAATATCGITVSWAAATPICGGTLSYSVYRSTTPGFTPSIANKIATGISGTSFADDLNLAPYTKYYYVVRATEVSNATNEETNTVEKSAKPGTNTPAPGISYFDDLDGNRPANADAYWIPKTDTGTDGTLNVTTGCHYQSATKSWRFGAAGSTACGGTYPVNTTATLVLGGDGSTPGVNGFAIPASSRSSSLTFNLWYNFESRYDGAWLVYSTTGPNGPWLFVPDAVSATAPYISAGGYDNTPTGGNTIPRLWTATNLGANGSLKAVTVNTSILSGKTVWFGFRFLSEITVVREGLYLDDIRVTADAFAACTTNVPPPGPAVSYKVTGLPTSTKAGTQATFNVTALDAVGQTATGYTGTASFVSTDAQAVLPPDAAFTAGEATNVAIEFRTLGSQTVTASDTASPAVSGSGSTTVTPGDPVSLFFATEPSDTVAGNAISPSVAVGMKDQFGNPVTVGTNTITLALGNNPGGGTLAGTTTVDAVNGVATFDTVGLTKVGAGYTLNASADSLTGASSQEFAISPAPPAKMAITTQPTTTVAGDAISAITLVILDEFDNTTDSSARIYALIADNPGQGKLGGSAEVDAANGVATFGDLWIDKVGTGYTLVFSSDDLDSVTSDGFNITPAVPHHVYITQQPSDVVAGAPITPAMKVTVYDRFENVATQTTAPVSVSFGSNPRGSSLKGKTSVVPVSGVSTFSDLSISKPGPNYTLIAGSSGLRSDTSVGFDVTKSSPNAVEKLVFKNLADHFGAGETISGLEVEVQDEQGSLVTEGDIAVTLSLGENPAGGQLIGNTTVNAVNGVAKFDGISVRKAGSGYALAASATGYMGAMSSAFAVNPGAAASFAVTVPASVTAGAETTISATAYDAYGNVAASYGGSVKVTSSDNAATFAATATFVEGKLSNFKVTFKGNGPKTVTLTDANNANLNSSAQTNVTPFAQPTAAVTTPSGGTSVSGQVSITATGAVATGTTLTKLAILVDGKEIASGTDGTLTGTWNSDEAEGGSHIITAVVTDGAGNVVDSSPVIVFTDSGCGCGATSGTDAGIFLVLLVLAHYMLGRRRKANTEA